jgi:hypothetical protein
MPNSASDNSRTAFPLSPAERSRLYRRRFRVRRGRATIRGSRVKIRVSDDNLNGLVKRGYLGPNELDDVQATKEALSLFLWDKLQKSPKRAPDARRLRRIAIKRAKR